MNVRLERATHVTKEQEWTLIRMDLIVISVILRTFVRGRRESSSFWSRHGFQRKSVEEATSKTRPSNLEKLRMDPQFLFDAIRILKLQM